MNEHVDSPLVSIGMPVYNEERFIDASLLSLRDQDYPSLEIVIVDNASTDRTLEICESHAANDSRIRIVRSTVNCGAIANFQRAQALANGTYFMWASGHDLWTPNLISECVGLLVADDKACIAFGCSRWIWRDGSVLPRTSGWTDTRGLTPVARLFTVLWGNMHPILGVIRISQLRAAQPLLNLTGGDLVLLAELALRGHFVHATNATWSRREFRIENQYQEKLQRYASKDVAIAKSRLQRLFPLLQLPLALLRVVWRSEMSAVDKAGALLALTVSFPLRYVVGRRGSSD